MNAPDGLREYRNQQDPSKQDDLNSAALNSDDGYQLEYNQSIAEGADHRGGGSHRLGAASYRPNMDRLERQMEEHFDGVNVEY